MESHACLVNVARGRHVVTDDLVAALTEARSAPPASTSPIPSPCPTGHPLWALDNCLITPHTANTEAMAVPLLAGRITENVRRFGRRRGPGGVVDPDLGY